MLSRQIGRNHTVSKGRSRMAVMNDVNPPGPPYDVQDVDRRILAELAADGRLGKAELARRVALSPPSVAERLRRMEAAGVIRGYHADIDPAMLGFPVAAVLRVRPAVRQLASIQRLAEQQPEIVECHRITGDDCFLMKVHARSLHHLEQILDRFLIYGQTTTSIIQSTPVRPRPIPLDV
jgi:Lrp/AsnC family leucine-responsive transcriptional regulator